MTKAMIFIDGSWLYSNTPKLAEINESSDFRIDFGELPNVLVDNLEEQTRGLQIDLVRTFFFSSYATNYDPEDEEAVQKRLNFFEMLREKYHYEVEVFPVDFHGRRLSKDNRDPDDRFEPQEKCVDISLASSILYNAAIPNAYDIAICVLGERDFKPVLKNVRNLGKRVAIASIHDSCGAEISDESDSAGIRDFEVVWLDELVEDIKLTYDRHQLVCQSPMHEGEREVWTTYHPKEGEKFYCDECREKYKQQQNDLSQQQQFNSHSNTNDTSTQQNPVQYNQPNFSSGGGPEQENNHEQTGWIKKKFPDRGYGFIQAKNGRDYFFHLSDLMFDLNFDDIYEGLEVDFMIKKESLDDEAGAATNVRTSEN